MLSDAVAYSHNTSIRIRADGTHPFLQFFHHTDHYAREWLPSTRRIKTLSLRKETIRGHQEKQAAGFGTYRARLDSYTARLGRSGTWLEAQGFGMMARRVPPLTHVRFRFPIFDFIEVWFNKLDFWPVLKYN